MAAYVIYPTDEQKKVVEAFLEALEISFVTNDSEELPTHVVAGISRGRDDIKAGRFTAFEEIKQKYPVK